MIENRTLPTEIRDSLYQPTLSLMQMPTANGSGMRINWHPHVDFRPGSNFYAKYRMLGNNVWNRTDVIYDEDFVIINDLPLGRYQIAVVSIGDQRQENESRIEEGDIFDIGRFAEIAQLTKF